MNKQQDRKEILNLIEKYYNNHLKVDESFNPGDRISYAGRYFDQDELINLVDASLDFWLTAGRYCDEFEKKLAMYLGVKYSLLVNSGSSANLLAFMALTSPLLKNRQLKKGDEVITVAACFPTTVAPIIHYGAVPVFLDIDIPTYNVKISDLEKALTSKTKAVFLAHTLGNPFDLKQIKEFCDKHNLWLIEDNCDALGSEYILNGKTYKTGTIGDIGTSSFYPPHHMTMGEGGAVYTNNPLLNRIMSSLRDWGRDCVCKSGQDNFCGRRFSGTYGQLPNGYDHKYVYSHFGYNLKVTEMQAAIGVAQLNKLAYFSQRRKENFNRLKEALKPLTEELILPEATTNSNPSWFGFMLVTKRAEVRKKLVDFLERNNIQTRMLFASNIILHPCFDQIRNNPEMYRVIGDLKNTNKILHDGFWLGVSPVISIEKIDFIIEKIKEFFANEA